MFRKKMDTTRTRAPHTQPYGGYGTTLVPEDNSRSRCKRLVRLFADNNYSLRYLDRRIEHGVVGVVVRQLRVCGKEVENLKWRSSWVSGVRGGFRFSVVQLSGIQSSNSGLKWSLDQKTNLAIGRGHLRSAITNGSC
jgi:hypothetical protein